jgi:hypothetical protein
MSIPVQTNDIAKQLAALTRRVGKLLKRFDQYVPTAGDLTIPQLCAKHQISRAGFYNLKKRGKGPRTVVIDGVIRITAEADREWVATHQSGGLEVQAASAE